MTLQQTQCHEFKKKLNGVKELVVQSDTNLALEVPDTKRSLHGALESTESTSVDSFNFAVWLSWITGCSNGDYTETRDSILRELQ